MDLEGIDHVALTVMDMDRAIDWYQEVLGMERRHEEWGRVPGHGLRP